MNPTSSIKSTSAAVFRTLADAERLSVVGISTFVRATAADTAEAFSLFETHDRQGDGPPLHIHRNEAESMFILSGNYLIQARETITPAGPGSFVHFPIGVPHTYKQTSEGEGRMLIWTTPGGYEEFFRAMDALAKENRLDPRTLTARAKEFGVEIVGPPIQA